uniref:Uncharacterized protein n=1 Tax=Human betaherpesvirus 6 TaxID=10368 RepID=A0A1W6DEX0_9BETA|nr:hypothetical protein [Human betaherpesvirus 6]QFW66613.1 hypothetical protein [Human betaherpesvirus 6]QFX43663.1 hypothetical protein [Human betaherpesvirus 6]
MVQLLLRCLSEFLLQVRLVSLDSFFVESQLGFLSVHSSLLEVLFVMLLLLLDLLKAVGFKLLRIGELSVKFLSALAVWFLALFLSIIEGFFNLEYGEGDGIIVFTGDLY